MAKTAQISKEKRQSIITLRHEGQSIRKMSRTLNVSSSAGAKPIKRYDETGSNEGSSELPASEIAAQINVSQSSSNRHNSTSTESGLHGRIAAKKPTAKRQQ